MIKDEYRLDDKIQIFQWCAYDPDFKPNTIDQGFSNFLHQVPPWKIFASPSTTIMNNVKIQYTPTLCILYSAAVHTRSKLLIIEI